MKRTNKKSRMIAVLLTAALVFGATPMAAFGAQAQSDTDLVVSQLTVQAKYASGKAGRSSKNKKAHKAYKKKLVSIKKKNGFSPSYEFIDLTNDGIDEMIVAWWPTIYTYKSGKIKKVDSREIGSVNYVKAYKKKKVITYFVPDHMGSGIVCYAKWNGKKFKTVAATYNPIAAKTQGVTSSYSVKGKRVSKDKAEAYIKKLIGKAKATKIGYGTYTVFE